jgi:hypothetical protein
MTADPEAKPQVTTVKLGKFTLTGPAAFVAIVIILGVFVALVVYAKPRLGMLRSGAIWRAILVFTPQRAAPSTNAEPRRSRASHQLLMTDGASLSSRAPSSPIDQRRFLRSVAPGRFAAYSAIRVLTSFRTSATGNGFSAGKRMVPLLVS